MSLLHSHKPYKRNQKIYIFTTSNDTPSNISDLPKSKYSVVCIGFDCHCDRNMDQPSNFYNRWIKVDEGDLRPLEIALTMLSKKISMLEKWFVDTQRRRRINNSIILLKHLQSRVQQPETPYLAEENVYMNPLINIAATIGVVFYHRNLRKFPLLGDFENIQYSMYWTRLFNVYTVNRFQGASNLHKYPDASAIDVIYPEMYDDKEQKLCEYEKLYMNQGIASENRESKRRINEKREQEKQQEQHQQQEQLQAEQKAEEEARRLQWEAFDAENAEKQRIKDAEDAAREIAANKPSLFMSKLSNMLFPVMGGRTKRSKGSKRSKRSKRVKRSNRSKRAKRN